MVEPVGVDPMDSVVSLAQTALEGLVYYCDFYSLPISHATCVSEFSFVVWSYFFGHTYVCMTLFLRLSSEVLTEAIHFPFPR